MKKIARNRQFSRVHEDFRSEDGVVDFFDDEENTFIKDACIHTGAGNEPLPTQFISISVIGACTDEEVQFCIVVL